MKLLLLAVALLVQEARIPGNLERIGKNKEGFEELRNPKDGATLVLIPEGTFLSGKEKETARTGAYLISKFEITNDQFAKFLKETGKKPHVYKEHHDLFSKPNQPVMYTKPELAEEYAKWAGGRIPSDEEWEKAARGTDGRTYPWGETYVPKGATWPTPLWDD